MFISKYYNIRFPIGESNVSAGTVNTHLLDKSKKALFIQVFLALITGRLEISHANDDEGWNAYGNID